MTFVGVAVAGLRVLHLYALLHDRSDAAKGRTKVVRRGRRKFPITGGLS